MLEYYSYYSVGGYKDMYLGTSVMTEEATYFLPLLPVWEKKAKTNNDSDLLKKTESLRLLPQIKLLSDKEHYGFPKEAGSIISHGAYRVLLKQCSDGSAVLSVRDIQGNAKDEADRSVPFLIAIVGKTEEDKLNLRKLCAYVVTHHKTCLSNFSKLFRYDQEKNGVRFELAEFNKWINVALPESDGIINTIKQTYKLEDYPKKSILILPTNISKKLAIREQALQEANTYFISENTVIPADDNARLLELINNGTLQKKSKVTLFHVATAALIGFIAGYIAGGYLK